jgi:hypothetical protein
MHYYTILYQTQVERKINNGSMKKSEMKKFNLWAKKWDRIAFTCTFATFIAFIIIYIIVNTARNQ